MIFSENSWFSMVEGEDIHRDTKTASWDFPTGAFWITKRKSKKVSYHCPRRNSLRIMLYRVFLKLLKPHRSTRRCSQINSYFLTVTIQLPTGWRKRI